MNLAKWVNLVNLTPHTITIYGSHEATEPVAIVEPSGRVARIKPTTETVSRAFPFPLELEFWMEAIDLPDEQYGNYYICTRDVAEVVLRDDIYAPGAPRPGGYVGLWQRSKHWSIRK